MRTRHLKLLVRVTGGAVNIDNDTLKRMTLKEFINLGLQSKLFVRNWRKFHYIGLVDQVATYVKRIKYHTVYM